MLIAITQRRNPAHGGSDVLEIAYSRFYSTFHAKLIPIPNNSTQIRSYFEHLKIDGIILSGGGDVAPSLFGGNLTVSGDYSSERDDSEKILLEISLEKDLPVFGICRGLQAINVHFGGKLIQRFRKNILYRFNHRGTRHNIITSEKSIVSAMGHNIFEVNSYHNCIMGIEQLSPLLKPFAFAEDKTIEGIYHPDYSIAAVMWHPERENSPHALNESKLDICFFLLSFRQNLDQSKTNFFKKACKSFMVLFKIMNSSQLLIFSSINAFVRLIFIGTYFLAYPGLHGYQAGGSRWMQLLWPILLLSCRSITDQKRIAKETVDFYISIAEEIGVGGNYLVPTLKKLCGKILNDI